MATKAELQAQLTQSEKELELYKKAFTAQARGEKPDAIRMYEDAISGFSYEFWRLQAAHGGWVKINSTIYGIPQLIYVDDLGEIAGDKGILRHIYDCAIESRGY